MSTGTLLSVYGSSGLLGECGPTCYDAEGDSCECCCAGANHAKGKAAAIQWTVENAPRLKAAFEAKGYTVKVHVQLGLPLAAAATVHTLRGTENQEGAKMEESVSEAARWKALAEQLAGALRGYVGSHAGVDKLQHRPCMACDALAAFDAATRQQTDDTNGEG